MIVEATVISRYEVLMADEQTHFSVFCVDNEDRFVFAVKEFDHDIDAYEYARYWAERLDCGVTDKN